LICQDVPAPYEIIVVDDAPNASTQRLVEDWIAWMNNGADPALRNKVLRMRGGGVQLRYIPLTEAQGPAAARNRGWRAAQGSIIAFTDDDCVPALDWLRAGVHAFQDGVVGASGQVVVPFGDPPTDYERDAAHLQNSEFVTANCFYRREALAAVGGFDERFTMAWREDSDLFFKLLTYPSNNGHTARLVHVPDALVVHPVRSAHWGVSLRQQRKSAFNALLFKKHPELYRRKIQAAPPWHYYRIVLALLVALVAALAGRGRLARRAAGAWLMMTTLFSLQRLRGTAHTSRHVVEMVLTSILIPPLSIYWRLRGALKFRVWFL
jgi:cellulose synthase/poly-beta-1,6-N-acetylglucosamine synthase-like glycosyltransferase